MKPAVVSVLYSLHTPTAVSSLLCNAHDHTMTQHTGNCFQVTASATSKVSKIVLAVIQQRHTKGAREKKERRKGKKKEPLKP
jgi:hypothetical protein